MRRYGIAAVVVVAVGVLVYSAYLLSGLGTRLPRTPSSWSVDVETLGPVGPSYHLNSGTDTGYFAWKIERRGLLPTTTVLVLDGKAGPEYNDIDPPVLSPDGRRLACVARKGDKKLMVVDGQPGPEYDAIEPAVWSHNGRRLAYVARKGDKKLMVVDGEPGPEYDEIKSHPVFSPDGKHLAYGVRKDGKCFFIADGKAGPPCDDFWVMGAIYGNGEFKGVEPAAVFSPSGTRLAYPAVRGRKWCLVADGRVGPEYDWVRMPGFSPDGVHLGYVAGRNDKELVVLDGTPGPEYDEVRHVRFIHDEGPRIAYVAKKGDKGFLVTDGQPGPPYNEVRDFTFSPDGKRVAYLAVDSTGKMHVVVDGAESPAYDRASVPFFSGDGKAVAFVAWQDNLQFVVVNGQAGPRYDAIWPGGIVLRTPGTRVTYGAFRGPKWVVFIDGQKSCEYDIMREGEGLWPSPDGRHVAYRAWRDGKWFVVVDRLPGPALSYVGAVHWSPDSTQVTYGTPAVEGLKGGSLDVLEAKTMVATLDGKHVESLARKVGDSAKESEGTATASDSKRRTRVEARGSKQVMVVDGREGPEYDKVGPATYSPDGKSLAYSAIKGAEVMVVVDSPSGPNLLNLKCSASLGPAGNGQIAPDMVDMVFSQDGKHLACAIHCIVYLDGHAGTKYDAVYGRPCFSPDGKHLAYLARNKGVLCVILDGQVLHEFKTDVGHTDICFGPDGEHPAWRERTPPRWFVVSDGEKGPEYDNLVWTGFAVSKDGASIAFVAKKNGKMFVVLNGQAGPEYDLVEAPVFNAAGALRYLADKDKVVYRVTHTPR